MPPPDPAEPGVLAHQFLHFTILLFFQLLDEAPEDGHLELDVLSDLGGREMPGSVRKSVMH